MVSGAADAVDVDVQKPRGDPAPSHSVTLSTSEGTAPSGTMSLDAVVEEKRLSLAPGSARKDLAALRAFMAFPSSLPWR